MSGTTDSGSSANDSDKKSDNLDTGLACLILLARFHGVAADADQLKHEFGVSNKTFGTVELIRAAKYLNLKAKRVSSNATRLKKASFPLIAIDKNQTYFIIGKVSDTELLIQRADDRSPSTLSWQAFTELWSGELFLVTRRSLLPGDTKKFDFSWFIPSILK
ncbi:MAG: type I secretion system permease/ATPase, partial [Gammaproteobacteria bacterium]|nr:type I secretion system permease/ATPase [Gammaproteobacteria bacterium]